MVVKLVGNLAKDEKGVFFVFTKIKNIFILILQASMILLFLFGELVEKGFQVSDWVPSYYSYYGYSYGGYYNYTYDYRDYTGAECLEKMFDDVGYFFLGLVFFMMITLLILSIVQVASRDKRRFNLQSMRTFAFILCPIQTVLIIFSFVAIDEMSNTSLNDETVFLLIFHVAITILAWIGFFTRSSRHIPVQLPKGQEYIPPQPMYAPQPMYYGQPMYGQPIYGQPVYGQPPVYGQQPVYPPQSVPMQQPPQAAPISQPTEHTNDFFNR